MTETPHRRLRYGRRCQMEPSLPRCSADPRLDSLHRILADLHDAWPEGSITTCYDEIPDLHPFARLAIESTRGLSMSAVQRLHVFTDGSASKHSSPDCKAAWAFHVVCESGVGLHRRYHRVGFTGAPLDESWCEGPADALDAEAMALLHVADWLMSQRGPIACTVHFDAQAVGFGTAGVHNVACEASEPRLLQGVARALFAVAQARHSDLVCRHVKAHAGQPDNEIADSVAYAILRGWRPPCSPPLRFTAFANHPLRDWVWLECEPSIEIPSIVDVLRHTGDPAKLPADYFAIEPALVESAVYSVTWTIGTANVCTLDETTSHVSDKVAVLQKQMAQEGLDILVLQECRGRQDFCWDNDDFIRVGSAAERGQGGVEIWLRKQGSFLATGFGDICKDHLVVWHSDPRIVGLSILHPALECDIIGIYAPQSGRESSEIRDWWRYLLEVADTRPSHGPVFLIGDANAKIGAVTSAGIGDLAPDFEDDAGEMLRACCDKLSLVLPATFEQWHVGPTATFSSTRGGQSRVDYVAVPSVWSEGIESSWVCEDFDLLNGSYDHKLVVVTMTLQVAQQGHRYSGRRSVYDRNQARTLDGMEQLAALGDRIPEIPWNTDVNDHWTILRQSVRESCQMWFPKPKRTKRQPYLSDLSEGPGTWCVNARTLLLLYGIIPGQGIYGSSTHVGRGGYMVPQLQLTMFLR